MAYFERTKITDENGNLVNPATEESVILLRRIARLLESQATVDPQQRQRIAIDSIATGLVLSNVATVTAITNALPAGTNTIGTVLPGGWNQQMFSDPARTAYNTGIRRWLTFS